MPTCCASWPRRTFPPNAWPRPDPLSVLDGQSVLVTEYVDPVPARRAEGGDQELRRGAPPRCLARAAARPARRGGGALPRGRGLAPPGRRRSGRGDRGVHPVARRHRRGAPGRGPGSLCHAAAGARPPSTPATACRGRWSIRTSSWPTWSPPAERGLVLVDWTGAGRAARAWSLAFLLFAEGAKNLARVDLVSGRVPGACRPRARGGGPPAGPGPRPPGDPGGVVVLPGAPDRRRRRWRRWPRSPRWPRRSGRGPAPPGATTRPS